MSVYKQAENSNRSVAYSIVPILILAFMVIGTISILSKNAYDTNEKLARQTELRRVETALDNEAREFAEGVQREIVRMVQNAPNRNVEATLIAQYVTSEHNADFVAIYAKGGKLLSVLTSRPEITERRLRAADELLAERRSLQTPFAIRRLGMSSTIVESRAVIAMAAIAIDNTFEMVVTRRMDDQTLTRIGANLMLPNLRLREVERTSPDSNEAKAFAIEWTHVASGGVTLDSIANVGYLGMVIIGLYGLIVFLHIRRVTHELEAREAAARHMAGHDSLSGLPNRVLFSRLLESELRKIDSHGVGLAVMYLDLDRFKEVNDQLGHSAGDKLIVSVAERMGALLRGADTVARFGGDEFAIIQLEVRSPQDCEALANRILNEMRRPFLIDGVEVSIGASLGISCAPENGTEAAQLMRCADIALYRAKNTGRNRFSFFENTMDEAMRLKKVIEDDLRTAIDTDQLTLRYQPIFSADGSRIVSVEALVRWTHPTMGMITPDKFIGVAEERGLIAPLGDWVLRRACIDARRWPDLLVAVNISPIQFKQTDFVGSIGRILEETGMAANRLELEVTEGVVIDDADTAESAMFDLRAMGVRLSLDDFGVGYSSLIYLRRFAFDKIKIDRSFLEAVEATGESAILVHSIVHLGRALGLEVVAEGVETEEQRRFLQAVGCHYLQGYLFARPSTPDEVDDMLARMKNGQDIRSQIAA